MEREEFIALSAKGLSLKPREGIFDLSLDLGIYAKRRKNGSTESPGGRLRKTIRDRIVTHIGDVTLDQ